MRRMCRFDLGQNPQATLPAEGKGESAASGAEVFGGLNGTWARKPAPSTSPNEKPSAKAG
jgi:hypothetical protein